MMMSSVYMRVIAASLIIGAPYPVLLAKIPPPPPPSRPSFQSKLLAGHRVGYQQHQHELENSQTFP